jgi:TetR/AcrR family transcriptional repressor of nem operon
MSSEIQTILADIGKKRRGMMMRKSKQEAALTRERIVQAAAAEFRQHGIVATGLADLMSAAGLTHGGFYRHFASKDQLVAEASAAALANTTDQMAAIASRQPGQKGLEAVVSRYLSTAHRDNRREGCAVAALGSELARADTETRNAATAAFLKLVDIVAGQIDKSKPEEAKKRAMAAVSMMIGALTMSRIVNDKRLSNSLLRNAQEVLTDL